MKTGTRTFNNDSKMTSIEGNTHEAKKGAKITVETVDRRKGICKVLELDETFKCKTVKGKTSIV